MDGALTFSVLKELFLRGSPSRGRGRSFRGRNPASDNPNDTEEMDRERRKECKDLLAIDLTGCISAVFYNALSEFVTTYIDIDDVQSSDEERGRNESPVRVSAKEPLSFPGLQRLCLLGVRAIQPEILHPFVLAFPSLTHLDLSATRVTPDLLDSLGQSQTIRLESLALSRCIKLTGDSITNFLIHGKATRDLKELNLYGDNMFPSNLTEDNLCALVANAPCFKSGNLEYLDLSSSPVTMEHLSNLVVQPKLRSLGLSYIPLLPLSAIADFLLYKASNVEILSIISTSPDLSIRPTAFQASMALHQTLVQPLCASPMSFQISLTPTKPQDPATHLRVIELSISLLNSLGGGAEAWRVIRSKGGRGWYVDTASGWTAETGDHAVLQRSLPRDNPLRDELQKLADANGNVNSGVGWHARKMEVLHGYGLHGREDGLYGAVAFAYQG